jgi:hypothetical protein
MRFQVLTAASMKLKIFWDVLPCSSLNFDRRFRGTCCIHHQALMMEAARTSETSVEIQLRTRQYIPEDSELIPEILFLSFNYEVYYRICKSPRLVHKLCQENPVNTPESYFFNIHFNIRLGLPNHFLSPPLMLFSLCCHRLFYYPYNIWC